MPFLPFQDLWCKTIDQAVHGSRASREPSAALPSRASLQATSLMCSSVVERGLTYLTLGVLIPHVSPEINNLI
jgi:hypothetical protein